MDELKIETPMLRTTLSMLVNKLCKKKTGASPDFYLQKLNIDSVDNDMKLIVDLKFTIRKNGLQKIVEKFKED